MDLTSILGLLAGLGLIVYGIMFEGNAFLPSNIIRFINMPSFYITIGGTIAATITAFPIGYFKHIPKHLKIIATKNKFQPEKYIKIIVEFAQDARRKGILSLEDKVNEQDDEFLKKSIMLIVDAIDPAKAKQMLENELDCLDSRHLSGVKIYEKASSLAPAFGMIGTLIGLINMLAGLDMDSANGAKNLTSGMAVALITTLYGSMLANMLLTPMANKLRVRHAEEMLCREIIVEGVLAIQAGDNPKHIEERLCAYLADSQRDKFVSKAGSSEDSGKKGRR
ncbi:motility protein A [Paludicola sp. MB14-C6]|uniref:motility protein A n=1 Tax=Paludihabitans sp. MB14-C6 TaxID=3070656 RepID=UPI0027DB9F29|nr:motility protein A [Paludicola sp. MB14-C6]WMJ24241.1 motility protein A [Paludicola sp. MB14-C6]